MKWLVMPARNGRKIVGIIQARMGSRRLPGKVLMPLSGAPMLQQILRRVSTAKCLDVLIVATSTNTQDDAIAQLCDDLNVPCHRGSEQNVLARYLDTARHYDADIIVRLTGDNPMVDGTLVDFVVDGFLHEEPPVLYANNIEDSGFPYGLYVEVVDVQALRDAAMVETPENVEHVTWNIRMDPVKYPRVTITAPGHFSHKSLTIDTSEEFEAVSRVFEDFFKANPNFTFRDVMSTGADDQNAHTN